jgi:hypothetical protein
MRRTLLGGLVAVALVAGLRAQEQSAASGEIKSHSKGLHGYVGFSAKRPPVVCKNGSFAKYLSAASTDQQLSDGEQDGVA